MGQHQTKEVNNALKNDAQFQNNLKSVNKYITRLTSDVITKNITSTKTSDRLDQVIRMTDFEGESIIIDNVGVTGELTKQLSSLHDTKLQKTLSNDVRQELITELQNVVKAKQSEQKDDAEQAFHDLIGGVTDVLSNVTTIGGKTDSSVDNSIQNIMNVKNSTTMDNMVENAIKETTVQTTISKVANHLDANQKIIFDHFKAKKDIQIKDIYTNFTKDQVETAVNQSAISDDIITRLTGFQTTDMTTDADIDQKGVDKETTVIKDAGDAFANVIKASTSWLIIGGIVIICFIAFGFWWLVSSMSSGSSENKLKLEDIRQLTVERNRKPTVSQQEEEKEEDEDDEDEDDEDQDEEEKAETVDESVDV